VSGEPSQGNAPAEIQFWRSGEWTGVYVDGVLVRHGDHYLADEWLQARYSVKVIDSDAWVPDGFHPLRTLELVAAEQDRRTALKVRAEALRRQAHDLTAEADRLDGQVKTSQA
jgi:hypothetical protein